MFSDGLGQHLIELMARACGIALIGCGVGFTAFTFWWEKKHRGWCKKCQRYHGE